MHYTSLKCHHNSLPPFTSNPSVQSSQQFGHQKPCNLWVSRWYLSQQMQVSYVLPPSLLPPPFSYIFCLFLRTEVSRKGCEFGIHETFNILTLNLNYYGYHIVFKRKYSSIHVMYLTKKHWLSIADKFVLGGSTSWFSTSLTCCLYKPFASRFFFFIFVNEFPKFLPTLFYL